MFSSSLFSKEKVNQSGGYRASVSGTEISGCTQMSGMLKKKNSHGVWQKRFFALNNEYLVYRKDAGNAEIKGAFDLLEITGAKVTQYGSSGEDTFFEIYGTNGSASQLKAGSAGEADKWVAAIMERREWCAIGEKGESDVGPSAVAAVVDNTLHISGWLMKKSHNKYQTSLQERFVKVEGCCLRYYKKESDTTEQGMVNLESCNAIRPYDTTPECTTFEIKDKVNSTKSEKLINSQ